ncbi:hypothetical protein CPA40_09895 [Bifidobacterium callitrichos]|uniref:Uncharacterized protein n=1 Tax=Bifidobacterium callitrichos TaxID=762209 RepID=A0A2T3G857_9BIFI|nr:hypothetical protein [Bifidobacterium callitrichos]PST45642.1 hypothetical protein CPA40_09895 [Bifidobacterium callitrichos]
MNPQSDPRAAMTSAVRRHAAAVIAAVIVIILELFVFNLPFWQTLGSHPVEAHDDGVGTGLVVEEGGIAVVTDPDQAWRDISSDQWIEYLYMGHTNSEHPHQGDPVRWRISTAKNTDGGWYDANADVGYSPSSEASRYSRVGGRATRVRIRYQMDKGAVIPYNPITVNPRVPLRFEPLRVAVEIIIAALIVLFRPSSRLYRTPFGRSRACIVPLGACAALTCLTPLALFAMAAPQESPDPVYWDFYATYQATDQYQRLADAILHGRPWLDYPVNGAFADMVNPYDTRSRTLLALNHPETPIYFDVAFHDGKYYSYFGVLPALLLFAPFKAVTGMRLPTNAGIAIVALLASVACALLVIQIARLIARRRPVSLGAVMLGMVMIMLGNGIAMLIQLGLFYQIPQEMAVACAAGGICLWIEARLRGLDLRFLAGGSLLMALTIACRPQVILASLIAIPLFADDIVRLWRGGLADRRGLVREAAVWACAIVPYLLVFAPQFAYNMVRFGSPTNFGATYNLTGYDMTHFHAPLTQYPAFVFHYLFQPPNLTAHFPFVGWDEIPLTTWRSEHPHFGGWFMTDAPFALILFAVVLWRPLVRRVKATGLIAGALTAAGLAFLINARITGVDYRYEIDFAWMLMIAVLVALYALDTELNAAGGADAAADVVPDPDAKASVLDAHDTLRRLVFGGFAIAVALAFLFLFLKQFADGMNMPVRIRWDVASWFLFM